MSRLTPLALVFTLALGVRTSAQEPGGGGELPNILVLVADDVGVDALAAYGEGTSTPNTPTIDALVSTGLLFRNAWASPVCSATRAGILTGRYGFRTGIGWLVFKQVFGPPLQNEEWTIPELLDLGAGGVYAHAAFGKWHLGNDSVGGNLAPNLAGFAHFSGSLTNLTDYFSWPKVVDGVASTSDVYATTDTVDSALDWIGSVSGPWFAYVAFNAAHTPFHSPPAELHTVDLTEPTDRLRYEAMVEALDTEIGRLLTGLAPSDIANTVVVFVGDNGSHAKITLPPFDPNHTKSTLYEGGINVPLIVSGPLVSSPGSEIAALVSTVDLCATVLDLAGVELASLPTGAAVDSVSFAPYLENPEHAPERTWVYAEGFRPGGPKNRPPYVQLTPTFAFTTCQDDLSFGGPGSSVLSICGEPLFGGYLDEDQNATLRLDGAPPSAPGFLHSSYAFAPTPMFGGTVVPFGGSVKMITTDAAGSYTQPIGPDADFLGLRYYQALVRDTGLPGGYDISNAIAVETLPEDMEAARDERYKLILDNQTGAEALFDLLVDPFEQSNLLGSGSVTSEQAQAYLVLRQRIFSLRVPVSLRSGK